MKKIISCIIILFLFNLQSVRAVETVTIKFSPIGFDAPEIINPLRGYYKWNGQEIIKTEVAPALDAYKRYVWRDLETAENNYDFLTNPNNILEKDMREAAASGQKYSFAVRALRGPGTGVSIPDYLTDPKYGGWWYDSDGNGSNDTFIPDWNNTYFLERADLLLAKLGQKYNSDPRVSIVVMRMYGFYGEWHMWPISNYADAPIKNAAYCQNSICDSNFRLVNPGDSKGKETLRRFIDMHVKAFPDKQLIMMGSGGKDHSDATLYTMSLNQNTSPRVKYPIGWRNDCLGLIESGGSYREHFRDIISASQWNIVSERWKTAPVMTEYCQIKSKSSGMITSAGLGAFDAALGQVKDFHVSLVSNGNFVDKWPDKFTSQEQTTAFLVGKTAGYRFQINQVSLPSTLTPNSPFTINSNWTNVGVAPVYETWDVVYRLRNSSGQISWQGKSALNLKTLLPASSPVSFPDSFTLPASLPYGTYQLNVLVTDPAASRTLPLALAIAGKTSDGSYLLGSVSVASTGITPTPPRTPTSTIWPSSPTHMILPADINRDGIVNGLDYVLLFESFNLRIGAPGYNPAADIVSDGIINALDYVLLFEQFGRG